MEDRIMQEWEDEYMSPDDRRVAAMRKRQGRIAREEEYDDTLRTDWPVPGIDGDGRR